MKNSVNIKNRIENNIVGRIGKAEKAKQDNSIVNELVYYVHTYPVERRIKLFRMALHECSKNHK
ncbi:hypothetical protein [Apilactobacillus apinorum]|uniref:Uncharacterized protein n=1 Tax=Apilactobacillus apinorum TaxID=1218495 RepID=A0ABP9ZGM5_9LACO|nr:hypothetical protein [Apilactobacillus apinorum]CAI2680037.1 hypothetical protein AAPFHON13_08670 [Apilactobacillus apinorum]